MSGKQEWFVKEPQTGVSGPFRSQEEAWASVLELVGRDKPPIPRPNVVVYCARQQPQEPT